MSETVWPGFRNWLGKAARLVGDLPSMIGVSVAENLIPSALFAPTVYILILPALGSSSVTVKSLKGIGIRTVNDPCVDAARYHPDGSFVVAWARCISI